MTNILTIDVEDYFQVENFTSVVKFSDWDTYECRVAHGTNKILAILAEYNTKATFFVLGWIAEKFPELVKKIHKEGHEIASHGYAHRLVYDLTPQDFKTDLVRSLSILEGIIGEKVTGFRAPSCSITKESLWAFEVMKDVGIKYDASIFPIHHDRYGIPQAKRFIHRREDDGIVELPLSTVKLFGNNIPVAGGGYFRLYPYWITNWAIRQINREGYPAVVYLHPWEFDPAQPRIKASLLGAFRHYVNIASNENKLRRLLCDFRFGPVRDAIR